MTKKKTVTGSKNTPPPKVEQTPDVAAASQPPNASHIQLKTYEGAIQLFAQRRLAEAREAFLEAAKGPAHHISDKARSYAQVCERRTSNAELQLSSAEDHFNYGVERLNARDVAQAKHHFDRALVLQPDGDHIFYTMALCCGLAGDGTGACEYLKRAIDLQPRNRFLARQDPEFFALAVQLPGLRQLLTPDSAEEF